ncbi:MAG: sensor histidine kinase [Roseburia sp.]
MRIPIITRMLEEKTMEYQNKLLEKQVQEVENIYLTMRGWRHDYHNHLQSMKAYVKMGQYEKLEEYLALLEDDLDQVNQLIESGNVNLDAILNSKISLALKNGIEVDYKAKCPAELTVSDIDLCALIGNLIDNAVESCEKMTEEDGKQFIRLYIGVLKQQLYISITNSTNEVVRKLDSEYISKKRGNHGHGLKRINLVVEKYQGYINRQNEPGVFVTEIMLPL